jgi:Tol biopolymer transport system component
VTFSCGAGIVLLSKDSHKLDPLVRAPSGSYGLTLSPDGSSVAYVNDHDVWLMASDGSQRRNLTPSGESGDPAWSPDGTRIAYEAKGGIWTADADGSNAHLVPTAARGVEPSWSPDGKTIVFTVPDRGWALYTASLNGSHLKLLRQPPQRGLRAEDSSPTWSPDGSHIAFIEVRETAPGGVTTQSSGGTADPPSLYDTSVGFAPQAQEMIPGSSLFAQLLTLYRPIDDLYWISPDGTGFRRLTHDQGLMSSPTWSRNSHFIAYWRYPGPANARPGNGIKIVNVATLDSSYALRGNC